ncbi:hypothetical protein [Robiginitalea sp.]|uniref:hypothetical protein n=1 Tax=Robiginitalea sp. TaxID=1902411 RepID=UPI003C7717A7
MKKNSDGPSCACGKEELFEVWEKNDKTKKEKLSSIKKENKDKASINTGNKSK